MIKHKVRAKKAKARKRKNPELRSEAEDILSQFSENVKFKYLSKGSESKTFYFTIKNSNILKSGEYVLKIFNYPLRDNNITRLSKLSNYGLIPKIFIIKSKFIIMKYVKGESLSSYIEYDNYFNITKIHITEDKYYSIFDKVKKLLDIWHELGFFHGDLHEGNILITENGKVYLIDPNLGKWNQTKQSDERCLQGMNRAILKYYYDQTYPKKSHQTNSS